MKAFGQSLEKIIEGTNQLKQVHKKDMQPGDLVLLTTMNSVYTIRVLEDSMYLVSGGWFDCKGLSPLRITITGCSWGGSVIKLDILAACGLCLEFGNHVVTSPVQKVFVQKAGEQN